MDDNVLILLNQRGLSKKINYSNYTSLAGIVTFALNTRFYKSWHVYMALKTCLQKKEKYQFKIEFHGFFRRFLCLLF